MNLVKRMKSDTSAIFGIGILILICILLNFIYYDTQNSNIIITEIDMLK